MDTGVEVSAPVNPDLVITPQPNEGDKLKQRFTESELQGIKENCLGAKMQSLWTTLVLTEFESVTLILVDWLIKGYENKYWGGAAPPMSVTWLPQRYRETPIADLKSYRAGLVKKAEAKSKTEASRSTHTFWSGAVVPPASKEW